MVFVLSLFSAGPVYAQEEPRYTVREIQQHWETLADLELRGAISAEEVASQRSYYLDQASALVGKALTPEELATWSVRENVINFSQVLRWLAIVVVIIAAVSLFGIYFFSLVRLIPAEAWEAILFLVAVTMLYGTPNPWVRFPGALLFGATLILTRYLHFRESRSDWLHGGFAALCAVVWGGATALHGSVELGFLTAMAIVTVLGFTVLVDPLCIGVGFRDEKRYLARGTFGALGLLVAGILLDRSSISQLAAFSPGLIGVGAFVYFIGLVIMSSKWVATSWSYPVMQIVALGSGFAALFLGPVLNLPWLAGVGGTLFCVYLLEKYIEIPWNKIGYAWGTLVFGGLLYGMAVFIHGHPQYFLIHW